MTTSSQPASATLQPGSDDKNLLTLIESPAGSCCGGSSCHV